MTNHRRFFIDPARIEGDKAEITGGAVRQIDRVLRLREGDSICLVDGHGSEFDAEIIALSAGSVVARILGSRRCDGEPTLRLGLAVCLPKGDKIELIVQKCTELGISELIVARSERSVPRLDPAKTAERLERWRRIATEAAEQSGRGRVPDIEGIVEFADLAEAIRQSPLALLACEGEGAAPLRDVLRGNPPQSPLRKGGSSCAPLLAKEGLGEVESNASPLLAKEGLGEIGSAMVIVGPEGGLTEEEARLAKDAGAVPISLGRRILRCETAAIAACAMVMYELENGNST